jgi:hypothetical protein
MFIREDKVGVGELPWFCKGMSLVPVVFKISGNHCYKLTNELVHEISKS